MGRRAIQYVVLGLLFATLAAIVWYQSGPGANPGAPPAAAPAVTRGQPAARGTEVLLAVPEVRLGALGVAGDEPGNIGRNPFRLQPKPAPQPVAARAGRAGGAVETAAEPPPPPPPPPIPLRLIGLVDASTAGGKIAVLSDGRDVFYGREGEIIDGRYRIVRIGAESVDMTYIDGRGARTIPLSVI